LPAGPTRARVVEKVVRISLKDPTLFVSESAGDVRAIQRRIEAKDPAQRG
jgi:hypothetical protein